MAEDTTGVLELDENDAFESKQPPQAGDPSRCLVVRFGLDNSFEVVSHEESEGAAQKAAEALAAEEHGTKFGVYQKRGTAQEVKVVKWNGAGG